MGLARGTQLILVAAHAVLAQDWVLYAAILGYLLHEVVVLGD